MASHNGTSQGTKKQSVTKAKQRKSSAANANQSKPSIAKEKLSKRRLEPAFYSSNSDFEGDIFAFKATPKKNNNTNELSASPKAIYKSPGKVISLSFKSVGKTPPKVL